MPRPSKADAILDATESVGRQLSFSGFTIRDVAERVGVRPAAVHYHFPTKARLMATATRRYSARFFDALGPPQDDPELRGAIAAFRAALHTSEGTCLCGVMASEMDALPDEVQHEVRAFFTALEAWLLEALAPSEPDAQARAVKAAAVLALLEGAMLTARALDDPDAFERATRAIPALIAPASL